MNEKLCSISTFSRESADSPSQPSNSEEYEQLSLWKLIPTHSLSSDTTSQEYQSTQISETTIPDGDNSTLLPADFPARERVTRELERDYLIQNHLSGEKEFAALSKLDPDSVLLNNLKELSDEDLELFLPDSIWQDTLSRLKQSRRRALELSTKDSDCLLFPTPTSNECSKGRPAGQTKCERWFKDKGLVPPGYQLGREAIALAMGFPSNWFEVLSQPNSNQTTTSSQPTLQEESEPDISQDEPLHQDKQPLLSVESSISIPCLVKQPGRDELKGVIQKDLGDRFSVHLNNSDETVIISKLYVYPDFDKSDEQINKCSSKSFDTLSAEVDEKVPNRSDKGSSKIESPSTKSQIQTRRRKGEGSGSIYYRTVIRNGKEYQQAYYHYKQGGKKRTKYIPQKLLGIIQSAETQKSSVAHILSLLGEKQISPSKNSDTSDKQDKINDEVIDTYTINPSKAKSKSKSCQLEKETADLLGEKDINPSNNSDTFSNEEIIVDEEVRETCAISPSKIESPSKTQRRRGEGSGSIHCKPIKRSGKEYKQYWYHYEFWREGDRLIKKSRYIPKRLLARVEKLEAEKAPVKEILVLLGVKG